MGMAGNCASMYLLLGPSRVGKTLLVKRLQNIRRAELQKWCQGPWRATSNFANADSKDHSWRKAYNIPEGYKESQVGTNLTDLSIGKKITIRELGGCMGPIWSSYYSDCHAVLYMIDAANPTQISSSCVQLLSLLSAEQLTSVPVLLIFNKIDLPCYMSLVEMKSLLRIQDIISCAKQAITVVEISARDGRGLSDVIKWLQSTLRD